MIEVREASVQFGVIRALKDASVTISQGESVGVFGPNGSGKSTLLNVMSGVISPYRGSVLLDDREVSTKGVRWFSKHGVGRTFQSARLFPSLSIDEVFSLGNVDEIHARDILNELSPQLNHSAFIRDLSTGQRRSVEISRLFASSARLLILDEPFAGLSNRARTELTKLISRKKGSISFVICDHDEKYLRMSTDRVLMMSDGCIEVEND